MSDETRILREGIERALLVLREGRDYDRDLNPPAQVALAQRALEQAVARADKEGTDG